MYCNCPNNWVAITDNTYIDANGEVYNIYICVNCKRRYIKRLDKLLETEFAHGTQQWYLTGRIKGVEI